MQFDYNFFQLKKIYSRKDLNTIWTENLKIEFRCFGGGVWWLKKCVRSGEGIKVYKGGGGYQRRIKVYKEGGGSKIDEFRAYVLFEWLPSKNSWFYLLQWKPFKNDECSLFHLNALFTIGKWLDKKAKVNFKFMSSQTGTQRITINICPNIWSIFEVIDI